MTFASIFPLLQISAVWVSSRARRKL